MDMCGSENVLPNVIANEIVGVEDFQTNMSVSGSIEHLGPHSYRVGERVYRNRDYAERAQRRTRARKRAILNAILNHRSIATAILVAKMRPWEA